LIHLDAPLTLLLTRAASPPPAPPQLLRALRLKEALHRYDGTTMAERHEHR
jgi:hypothetical protein